MELKQYKVIVQTIYNPNCKNKTKVGRKKIIGSTRVATKSFFKRFNNFNNFLKATMERVSLISMKSPFNSAGASTVKQPSFIFSFPAL